MADCEKCGGTGWMTIEVAGVRKVTRCVCKTRARAELEKERPGGFERVGDTLQDSRFRIQDSEEPTREAASDLEIVAGEGIRYAAARASQLPKPDREVAALIFDHRGKENAIKIDEICKILPDLNPRAVKQAVENIRREARVPIAASKEPPYGYFIPTTAEEARECHDRMFREGVKSILNSQLFGRDKDLVREFEGQLRLQELGASPLRQPAAPARFASPLRQSFSAARASARREPQRGEEPGFRARS